MRQYTPANTKPDAVKLIAWFIRLPDGRVRLATEAESIQARLDEEADS